jgi:hypothetical protein
MSGSQGEGEGASRPLVPALALALALTLPALAVLGLAASEWLEVWGPPPFLEGRMAGWRGLGSSSLSRNRCEMTYSRPYYFSVPVPDDGSEGEGESSTSVGSSSSSSSPAWYSLLRLTDSQMPASRQREPLRVSGTPVLFVPGHLGHSKQARSLGRHLVAATASSDLELDLFALDFGEELTALHGALAHRQSLFLLRAMEAVRQLYADPQAVRIILVAHSYGGIVSRLAMGNPSFERGSVSDLLTLGTPHAGGGCLGDATMQELHRRVVEEPLPEGVAVISIGGGAADGLVTPALCDAGQGPRIASATSSAVAGVGFGIDHKALLWCKQLLERVAAALVSMQGATTVTTIRGGREEGEAQVQRRVLAARLELLGSSVSADESLGFESERLSDWRSVSLSLVSDRAPLLLPAWCLISSLLLAVALLSRHGIRSPLSSTFSPPPHYLRAAMEWAQGQRSLVVLGIALLSSAWQGQLSLSLGRAAPRDAVGQALLIPSAPWMGLTSLCALTAGLLMAVEGLAVGVAWVARRLPLPRKPLPWQLGAAAPVAAHFALRLPPSLLTEALLIFLSMCAVLAGVLVSFLVAPSALPHVARYQRLLLLLYLPALPLSLGLAWVAGEVLVRGARFSPEFVSAPRVLLACAVLLPILCCSILGRMGRSCFGSGEGGSSEPSVPSSRRVTSSSHGQCDACFHEDGGKGALFVETDRGCVSVGGGVTIGPGFRVVACDCMQRWDRLRQRAPRLCRFCRCVCTTCGGGGQADPAAADGGLGGILDCLPHRALRIGIGACALASLPLVALRLLAAPYECMYLMSALAAGLCVLSLSA